MGCVGLISQSERDEATSYAIDFAREAIGEGGGYVAPQSRIGSLSVWEWMKIVEGAVSGWIIARTKHLSSPLDEAGFLATGLEPPPSELGPVAVIIPALGEYVQREGLTEKSLGEWNRAEVIRFAWFISQAVEEAKRLQKQERFDV